MKKIGVIGIKDGWSSERLVSEVEDRTGFRCLIDFNEITTDFTRGSVRCRNLNLLEFDAFLIKKIGSQYSPDCLDRLTLLHYLAKKGVRIFSEPQRVSRILNRLNCTVELAINNIPLPETVITENLEEAATAVKRFRKSVFKPLFTSKARGMRMIEDSPSTIEQIKDFQAQGNTTFYIQKFIEGVGQDLGVTFLGGKYLATYARIKKEGAWNTTILSGGVYAPHEPSARIIELARRAQEPFGLDFTCVDVIETPDGPQVFEVSAFGGFRGLWLSHQINAASLYVDYILEQLNYGKNHLLEGINQ